MSVMNKHGYELRLQPFSDSCTRLSSGEEIEITFSYWDGSGHRKTVKVRCDELRPLYVHLLA